MLVEIVSTAAELNKLHNESTICNTVLIVRLSVQSFKVFSARRYASLVYTVVMYLSICQSVCLSVKRRNCIETTGRVELVSGVSASFHLSYTVLQGNLGISKIRPLRSGTFPQKSGLRKFRHGKSIMLSTKLVDDRGY